MQLGTLLRTLLSRFHASLSVNCEHMDAISIGL